VDAVFDSGGVPIHYITQGEGEAVLMMHGVLSSADRAWVGRGLFDAVAQAGYRVIAYDHRGHGQSGKPHDPAAYGLEMIEDAVRLLDHLGIERAHVVGYSMGGQLANKVRERYPERVLSLTMGGIGWFSASQSDFYTQVANAIDRGSLEPLMRRLQPVGAPEPTQDEIAQFSAVLQNLDAVALAALVRAFPPDVAESSLRANRVPTLAIVGTLDPFKPNVDEMAGVMSNLRVVVIDGTNHSTTTQHPDFRRSLLAFLAEH